MMNDMNANSYEIIEVWMFVAILVQSSQTIKLNSGSSYSAPNVAPQPAQQAAWSEAESRYYASRFAPLAFAAKTQIQALA